MSDVRCPASSDAGSDHGHHPPRHVPLDDAPRHDASDIGHRTSDIGHDADIGLWQFLQLSDSAFPTGGFAHSGGLEAAWQLGEVAGRADLERYLADSLEQCGQASLPFATATYGEPARFAEWDRWCDATLPNHVANRASRALGQGLLTSAAAGFGRESLTTLKATVRRDRLPGHLAPVSGMVCSALGLGRAHSQRLLLFLHLRTLVSTAVRLGIVGPLEAQAIQHRVSGIAEAVWQRCADLGPAEAAASMPLHDLFQGHHDRLYSRLFMS